MPDRSVSTIQLIGEDAGVTALNQKLYAGFKEQLATLRDCPDDSHYEDLFEHQYSVEINFWSTAWITIRQGGYTYCNGRGAHPWSTESISTYDLRKGEPVDLWSWFQGKRMGSEAENREEKEMYYWLPEQLRKMILEGDYPHEDDSRCMKNRSLSYDLMLGHQGITFVCKYENVFNDGVEIPYPELLPSLTDEGKASVKSIMAESARQ